MIATRIEYKDGSNEYRTFIDWIDLAKFIDPNLENVVAIAAEQIDPQDLRQGKCDSRRRV